MERRRTRSELLQTITVAELTMSESGSRNQQLSAISKSGRKRLNPDLPTTCDAQKPSKVMRTNWITYDDDPRASTNTYASTIPPRDEHKRHHVEGIRDRYEAFPSEAVPSTPPTFGGLFPSCRRLLIRHDDSTRDGNLNLRISTLVSESRGRPCEVILFHLRMLDLQDRKFSIRRYCRQSGREVCHSSRKYQKTVDTSSPSWKSALWALRPKPHPRQKSVSHLKRQDSGYKSGTEEEEEGCEGKHTATETSPPATTEPLPTNTMKLEFSNYAHVDIERRGSRLSKRYDYEYWSTKYQWRRTLRHDGDSEEVSYHLYDLNRPKPIAHIVPEPLSPMEAVDEESKGGWIPPASIWISDSSIFKTMSDIAELVVPGNLLVLSFGSCDLLTAKY